MPKKKQKSNAGYGEIEQKLTGQPPYREVPGYETSSRAAISTRGEFTSVRSTFYQLRHARFG
jgi:hypothetical protein